MIMIGWSVKPLYGLVSDNFTIGSYNRKPYLIIGSIVSSVLLFYLTFTDSALMSAICMTIYQCVCAMNDVIVDALMVERTKEDDSEDANEQL
jgi:MFS-type transporter involved in bile tolerance (Atg22 family)